MIVQGGDYEHTLGFDRAGVTYQPGTPAKIGAHVRSGGAFDAAEFALSGVMILADRGALDWVPIPVFPMRAFVHSYLFVRQDSPLGTLQDLAGIRIGLRDFASTGAIWFRGLLIDLGIDWRSIEWVTGPSARFAPPPGARVTPSEGDLEQMLLDGEIDLFFSARIQEQVRPPGERRIRPLLRDARAQEAAAGLFPIIHTVVLSRAMLQQQPDAARLVFEAYRDAKAAALRRKLGTTFMPWAEANWADATDRFGGDPLPYGMSADNRRTVGALAGYLAEQGLTKNRVDIDALFHPDSAQWGLG